MAINNNIKDPQILIAIERLQQLGEYTYLHDLQFNSSGQLLEAANALQMEDPDDRIINMPNDWDIVLCDNLVFKPYRERLVIAGALLIAERERLLWIMSSIHEEHIKIHNLILADIEIQDATGPSKPRPNQDN